MEVETVLDMYAVIAEPSRRRIMDRLLQSDSSVTELVNALGMSQPLNPHPLAEVDEWLGAYRVKWNRLYPASSVRKT